MNGQQSGDNSGAASVASLQSSASLPDTEEDAIDAVDPRVQVL